MNVFIAGGTSGIGLELAIAYQQKGNKVAICGRNINKVDQSITPLFCIYEVDIYNKTALAEAVSDFCNNELDMLIISAGAYADDALNQPSYNDVSMMLKTNIVGVANAFDVARDAMQKKQKGHILVISSVSALLNYKKATTYSKTKRAIMQISDAYKRALANFGIKVTVVAPGYVDTAKLRQLNQNNLSRKPFVITSADAANIIIEGINKNKELIIFPTKMKYTMLFLSKTPAWFQSFIMQIKAKWMNQK